MLDISAVGCDPREQDIIITPPLARCDGDTLIDKFLPSFVFLNSSLFVFLCFFF